MDRKHRSKHPILSWQRMKKVLVDLCFHHGYYDILDYTSANYRSIYSYDSRKEKCLRVNNMKSISKENIEENQVLLSQVENVCEDKLHENYFEANEEKIDFLNTVGENCSEVDDCEVEIVKNIVQDIDEPKSSDRKFDARVISGVGNTTKFVNFVGVERFASINSYLVNIVDCIKSVRTYVNHVKNICHLELTNLLTKRSLLVIG